ncbi:hypothetical protein BASA60_008862 [Batrachochytrium salamandrivorans]|nr:hypothetical protein BASA60_008862 [Batrachochytrium salamandrivorans]
MFSTYCIGKTCITGIPYDTRARYALLILHKKDRHPVVSISGIACARSLPLLLLQRDSPPSHTKAGVMVPETSPAIDTTIYKLAAYLPLRRVGIFPAMQSALNRIGGMIQRNRELRQTPDSLQQVPTVAKLQYTCSTSIAWSLHLASNKRIETAGDSSELARLPMSYSVLPLFAITPTQHKRDILPVV